MWPGGDYNYSGINPTYLHTLDETIPFEKRMDEAVEWILDPEKPANLVLLHLEEPDATGHVFGPDSDEMTEQLSEMDSITKYLINKYDNTDLCYFIENSWTQKQKPVTNDSFLRKKVKAYLACYRFGTNQHRPKAIKTSF